MKKVLLVLLVIILIIVGGVWYLLSSADDIIHNQIEKQGSKYLQTEVNVATVTLTLREGRLTIDGLEVMNPDGFSADKAFNLNQLALDLGGSMKEPYVIDEVLIDAAEVLYEVNESGEGNLMVLKNNLQDTLPASDEPQPEPTSEGEAPLLIVRQVTVANTRLRINAEAMETGDLKLDQKSYDVTLPTFNAGSVGEPNGLPADQVGAAIFNNMLSNLISEAKDKAKDLVADKAKEEAKKKLEEEKGKLLDKANDKLKDLIDQ